MVFSVELSNLDVFYKSYDNELINEFYVPVLKESVSYDRAVGYFSSNILVQYIQGLENFVRNNGKMRLLISPQISAEDGIAMLSAVNGKDIVTRTINEMFESYRINGKETIVSAQLLHCLITEGILEIKVVKPVNKFGLFHEKIAIFRDELEAIVATNGSNNETLNAIKYNLESFNVFCSWKNGQELYCNKINSSFEETWGNKIKNYETFSLAECIDIEVFNFFDSKKELFELFDELKKINGKTDYKIEVVDNQDNIKFTPFPYQELAANKWIENKKGIIAFATGTGKTKTAILCIRKLIDKEKAKIFIIVVPDKTLVEQWSSELSSYNFTVIKCYSENGSWQTQLKDEIDYFSIDKSNSLFVVTTTATFRNGKFNRQIKKLNDNYVFISDECHRLGTDNLLNILPSTEWRLGLSATPNIYMSEHKTKKLFDYFNGILAEYSIEEAIKNKFLVEYDYYPIEVTLSENEMEKYKEITYKLVKMFGKIDEKNFDSLSIEAQMLLFQRSRIVYGAIDKIKKLSFLLDKLNGEKNMLIYCGATSLSEGEEVMSDLADSNSITQLQKVNNMLKNKHIISAQYTKDENGKERKERIDQFKKGNVSTLVAIKCLDEGIDIPEITTGIILASSGNPREFVQRRGRLLRKSASKEKAVIYDMVVVGEGSEYESINKNEINRLFEFAHVARNKNELMSKYNVMFERYIEENENE